ncbi:MAG: hypothetical protein IIA89_07665 [Chloroflexi bacterium]|nr:hypothetical protein [Chloroflexota bacterium]
MNTERTRVGWGFWLWWVLACTVGLTVAFAVAFAVTDAVSSAVAFAVTEAVVGAVVGASVGIAQWLVLRRQVSRPGWWVLASIMGLAVAFALSGAFALGGALGLVVYGAITGAVMVWLLRQPVQKRNANSM